MSAHDYTRHAHARTILAELQRYLLDRFVGSDGAVKAPLICEEAFYADREVPPEAILQVVDFLQRAEEREREAMRQYGMARYVPLPPLWPEEGLHFGGIQFEKEAEKVEEEREQEHPQAQARPSRKQRKPAAANASGEREDRDAGTGGDETQ